MLEFNMIIKIIWAVNRWALLHISNELQISREECGFTVQFEFIKNKKYQAFLKS